jgi:ABC-type nitrate/sulfonate/bicarbonate transport system substrate-binding protein
VTGDTARERKELLLSLCRQWRAASRAVAAQPEEAAAKYAERLGMSPAIVARSIPHTLFYVPEPLENRRRVEAYYELLRSFLEGERPPLSPAFFLAP